MLYLLVKTSIISLILIFLVHYLYDFFKTNLTIPKIKDLVNRPNDKYNEIPTNIIKILRDIKPIKFKTGLFR